MSLKLVGSIVIGIGIFFMTFGCIALWRFKNFYSRILSASLVDSAGFILIILGAMLYRGHLYFNLKLGLILAVVMILNPVSSHFITKSAYYSGYHLKKGD